MRRRVLLGIVAAVVIASLGLFFWARSVLARDTVRTALAAQLSNAIGQPVTIARIGAAIYPRVTVNLGDVNIGNPPRITVRTLRIGTDLGALLSRKIAHATVRLDGARIELPLPPFSVGGPASSNDEGATPPVEIVSIDEIALNDVNIVSGGRTLHGDIDVVPHGRGLSVRKASIRADQTTIDITGEITDTAGPAGTLALKTDTLDLDRLLAFVGDFSGGAGAGATPARAAPTATSTSAATSPMDLAVSLDAGRASVGSMTLDHLTGNARITPGDVTLDPIRFGVFGGRYDGTLAFALGDVQSFHLKASLAGVDVAKATAFAGSPDAMTGSLSGRLDLTGRGSDAAAVARTAHGTARVDVRDGIVKHLGLLRAVVVATSMRADARPAAAASGSSDEPFSNLGATLAVANGVATTNDLRFQAKDLDVAAAGSFALTGSSVNLKGQVQLSKALTEQAGRDLVRYSQEQGRVTLPVVVTGSFDHLSPRIDVASAAERAIRNRANDELKKVLKKGLPKIGR